uniref:Uncharacterized protein n=1 Tax=Brassica oleracea TaxID=3712 RepID=A0A3P6G3B3_BRAOL|nr:unnamed protein product [Brassica oleracea]
MLLVTTSCSICSRGASLPFRSTKRRLVLSLSCFLMMSLSRRMKLPKLLKRSSRRKCLLTVLRLCKLLSLTLSLMNMSNEP